MLAVKIAEKLYKGRIPQDLPFEQRGFQDEAFEKLKTHRRHILGLPMGVGKTVVGVRALKEWAPRRSLIVPTERAILAWLKVMWIWYPEILERYAIVSKNLNKTGREKFWKTFGGNRDLSVITNYQLLTRDKEFLPNHFDSIMVDEYHKFMRNRGTNTQSILKKVKSDALLLISGSPVSKGPQDFFVPLNLIDPRLFSSYWKFVGTWCNTFDTGYGKKVYGTRNVEQFKKMIKGYAILATKKQLGMQKKVRDILPVTMDDDQAQAYADVRDELLLVLEDAPPVILLNTLSQYIKLRQLLSCPAIVSPSLGIGGGAKFIANTLLDLPIEERHSVIFTPFRSGIPYLKAYYEGSGRSVGLQEDGIPLGIPVYTFTGGMGLEKLFSSLHDFKRHGGLAICTTQFAESFDMETADKCFMLGYDWDPQVNFQAEDRLDRLNNLHGLINVYYLLHEGTLDEDVLYTLVMKQTNVNALMSNKVAFKSMLASSV